MWSHKVMPDPEAQLAGESFVSAKKVSTPSAEVEKSLASIRSHRSDHNADQDDVPFAVKDWSPSCLDVATDGYALFNLFLQATTSLFFLAIAYTDALGILAVTLLYYALVLMACMFLHLANFKGRQFVYAQLLQRKVLLDLTAVTWYKSKLTQAIFVALILAIALFIGTWIDTNGPTRGSTAAAFAVFSSLLMVVLKQKLYLQQERTLVPMNFIMQDDPEDANAAPIRKAWVDQLKIIKEVDFQRYVASRYVKFLTDPAACAPLPHGRDKWDVMAAEMMADPELTDWPAVNLQELAKTELWTNWTPKQRSNLKDKLTTRFGYAFYFSTVGYDRIEVWRPWVLTTVIASITFVCACAVYGGMSGAKKGDAALQPCT